MPEEGKEKIKDILLNDSRVAFFESGTDNHIHQATLQDNILLELGCFVVLIFVLCHLHRLTAFFPRIPHTFDNVFKCNQRIFDLIRIGSAIAW